MRNVFFTSEVKTQAFLRLQNSSAIQSQTHTVTEQKHEEKGCPFEKGEFHLYLAVESSVCACE